MKLQCLARYRNRARGLQYEPGVIDVPEDIAAFLKTDAPGTFAEVVKATAPVEPPDVAAATKEMPTPPRTTAMGRAPRSKTG